MIWTTAIAWRRFLRRWLPLGATHTSCAGWVKIKPLERNIVTTFKAISEFLGIHSGQRGNHFGSKLAAPHLGCFRHSLLLHRIHPTKATDRLLIQSDRFLCVGAQKVFLVKLRQKRVQLSAKISQSYWVHHDSSFFETLYFGTNAYLLYTA